MVSITCDKESNAFYIKISNNKIVKTISSGHDTFIDVDERGEIAGFEILDFFLNMTPELSKAITRTKGIEISV